MMLVNVSLAGEVRTLPSNSRAVAMMVLEVHGHSKLTANDNAFPRSREVSVSNSGLFSTPTPTQATSYLAHTLAR